MKLRAMLKKDNIAIKSENGAVYTVRLYIEKLRALFTHFCDDARMMMILAWQQPTRTYTNTYTYNILDIRGKIFSLR